MRGYGFKNIFGDCPYLLDFSDMHFNDIFIYYSNAVGVVL